MLKTVFKGKEVRVVGATNVELVYAPDVLERVIQEQENEGWKRFGPLMPIYDKKTEECLFIQVLIKDK